MKSRSQSCRRTRTRIASTPGGVAERLKAADLKSAVGLVLTRSSNLLPSASDRTRRHASVAGRRGNREPRSRRERVLDSVYKGLLVALSPSGSCSLFEISHLRVSFETHHRTITGWPLASVERSLTVPLILQSRLGLGCI